jgi:DNA modification methylase
MNGFVNPVLVDEEAVLIAGHGRLMAAKKLDLSSIPVIVLQGLSDMQKRQLAIADNAIAANSGWDLEKLALELSDFVVLDDFEPLSIGFEPAEIDRLLFEQEENSADPADALPTLEKRVVSTFGDLYSLGGHRLLCGDARVRADFDRVMNDDLAAMAFLDPPYNVRINGVVGRGERKHDEFAMASGEMSEDEFASFLKTTLGNAAAVSSKGAVHFDCMDWRHIGTLIDVGRDVYGDMLNLVTWVKSNAGQGSFYRGQHELIGVFRVGDAAHLNNIELGRHGRNRSNVWHYAGVNSFGKGRLDDLAVHPTVKPVGMIVDAIKDCTKRGDIVLDCFAGSGTTMLACERTGRRARSIEYEPRYVDATIRRWQAFTRKDAVHVETGRTFDEMAAAAEKEGK